MARVATIGSFDGLHAGHRVLLERLREVALEHSATPLVVTFDHHPRTVMGTMDDAALITPTDKKIERLRQMGFRVEIIPFDEAMRQKTGAEFLRDVILPLGIDHLVVGFNNRFGSDHAGPETALEAGLSVTIVPPHLVEGAPVSSTRIRNLLAEKQPIQHLL